MGSAVETAERQRWVYGFVEGSREMTALLGGKGANLAEMTTVLGPDRVPGGFTITTRACVEYMRGDGFPDGLEEDVDAALADLERSSGKRFGDPDDPLLLSVRSGAPVSMPGMLDTVLNLGLNDAAVRGLAARTGNAHFAWDSFRRLVQMYADVVRGVPSVLFEGALDAARADAGAHEDRELDAGSLEALARRFQELYAQHTGDAFPADPREQLRRSIRAVFDSWKNERAVTFRRLNDIPDELGTAVTVQRMVFGNLGESSGSGVAFSRDPATGAPEPSGDFLLNAQGEDVVAGTRNTEGLDGLARRLPEAHARFLDDLATLERHYGDMQDVEYTVEDGRLYILQTRNAKRPAQAAVRFARDAVAEGLLGREQALATIDPASLDALLHPTFDPAQSPTALVRGVPASPGAARGAIVFSAAEAERSGAAGEDVILVRQFTSAEDVGGFDAARGILTSRGGKSSHAAIVARGMGRPCVCGAAELEIDEEAGTVRVAEHELRAGDVIALDGTTGVVTTDEVELISAAPSAEFATVLGWADEIRRLGVRANADTGADAARARELGAEGIGLCRTEHMFFGNDRERLVRDMFIAGELWRRSGDGRTMETTRRFEQALARLGDQQRSDFAEIFAAMAGLPVTVRLLDPPMHEFVSVGSFERELADAERDGEEAVVERVREQIAVAAELEETNPMLGTRGVRLGLLLPPLYEMQVRAIAEAALEVAASEGPPPRIEIMVPLVAFESELEALGEAIRRTVEEVTGAAGRSLELTVGTMIELPSACLIAGEIAERADFFSFGTNDLTQTSLGLSRDDAERSLLPAYLDRGLLARSPFETIHPSVAELVEIAVARGRGSKADLKLGICGEHGGDPRSIEFFESADLDYVSCSPYRLPTARIAAAQAAVSRRARERLAKPVSAEPDDVSREQHGQRERRGF